jgi:hypothetical protein
MTMARHDFTAHAAGRRALVALRVLFIVAALFFITRAVWFNGFNTGADATECLDLFTLIGDEARTYDVCVRARDRFERDLLAQMFADDAELQLRRGAAVTPE